MGAKMKSLLYQVRPFCTAASPSRRFYLVGLFFLALCKSLPASDCEINQCGPGCSGECTPACHGYDPCCESSGSSCSNSCGNGESNPDCRDECPPDCPVPFAPDPGCKIPCGKKECGEEMDRCDIPPDACGPGDPSCKDDNPSDGPKDGCKKGSCERRNQPGVENVSNESFKFHFGMGLLPGGFTAPHLRVHRRIPDAYLASPSLLRMVDGTETVRYDVRGNAYIPGIEVKKYSSIVRQVKAPQVFANVLWDTNQSIPNEYYIHFYTAEQAADWPEVGGYYQVDSNETPFVSFHIYNPNPNVTPGLAAGLLRIDKIINQQIVTHTITRTYEQDPPPA
jgi:hypothetical protein